MGGAGSAVTSSWGGVGGSLADSSKIVRFSTVLQVVSPTRFWSDLEQILALTGDILYLILHIVLTHDIRHWDRNSFAVVK